MKLGPLSVGEQRGEGAVEGFLTIAFPRVPNRPAVGPIPIYIENPDRFKPI